MQIMDRVRVARVCGGDHDAREVGLEGGIYEVLPDRAHRYVVALDTPLPATPATSRHPASFYDSLQFSEDELEVIDTPRADAGEDTDEVCHL